MHWLTGKSQPTSIVKSIFPAEITRFHLIYDLLKRIAFALKSDIRQSFNNTSAISAIFSPL